MRDSVRGIVCAGTVGYLPKHLAWHSLKSVTEHFGRDPVVIRQGVGKVKFRVRENENFWGKINELTKNMTRGKKRILI
jgi:hypothetical protein